MSQLSESHQQTNLSDHPWFICALVLFFLLLWRTVTHSSWNLNHDCAMYIVAGQLLVAGKAPYVDFVDLNPPLVFYLNAIPVALSKLTATNVISSFEVCVWLFAIATAFLCLCLNLKANDKERALDQNRPDYLQPMLFGFAMFNFLTGEWGEFGQRQHLAAIGMMPFFICRWRRHEGDAIAKLPSILSGTIFGITVCLVPQYALVPVTLEAFWFLNWRKDDLIKQKIFYRLFDLEIMFAIACIVAYTAHLWALSDNVKQAFFGRVIPAVLSGYSAYNCDWLALTVFPALIGCFPLLIAGAILAAFYRCTLTVPLLLWCISAYLAALVQLKGWYNHYLPLLAGTCLLVATQVRCAGAQPSSRIPKSALKQILVACLIFFVCAGPSVIIRESLSYPKEVLQTILKESKPTDSIIFISPNVPDIYPPLLESGRTSGSRYLFYFTLEMYRHLEKTSISEDDKRNARRELEQLLSEIKEDIDRSKPKLIFISEAKDQDKQNTDRKPATESTMQWLAAHEFVPFLEKNYLKIGTCKGRSSKMSVWKRND